MSNEDISRAHVIAAIEHLNQGGDHPFGTPRLYQLVYDGKKYPPKAAVGIARTILTGTEHGPHDLHGGESGANRILRNLGFEIERIRSINFQPTADLKELDRRVNNLRSFILEEKPEGTSQPEKVTRTTVQCKRDPVVKAWILENAKGVCEACDNEAPFEDDDGRAFLEVHHVEFLADGGPDIVENAVAICPNCHRRLHHGRDRLEFKEMVLNKVNRLERCHLPDEK